LKIDDQDDNENYATSLNIFWRDFAWR